MLASEFNDAPYARLEGRDPMRIRFDERYVQNFTTFPFAKSQSKILYELGVLVVVLLSSVNNAPRAINDARLEKQHHLP